VRKKVSFGFVVALQLAYLGSTIFYHQARIHSGIRVLLKTEPVDPVSIFRGRYLQLNYSISRLLTSLVPEKRLSDFKTGNVVYVQLEKWDPFWEVVSVEQKRPSQGTFLRGRVQYRSGHELWILYGIEAFFLSEASASEIEKHIRSVSPSVWKEAPPLTVEVAVAKDGTGYPVKLFWKGKEYR